MTTSSAGAAMLPPHLQLDTSGTSAVPFWRLAVVEFRKSYDTRAGMWLLIAIGILVALVEAFVFVVTLTQNSEVYYTDFVMIGFGLTSLLLPVLAILLVTSEWSQRSAMVSFALEPRRIRVILAKWFVSVAWVAVTIVVMLVVALVLTAICSLVHSESTHWTGTSDGTPSLFPMVVLQVVTMTIGFAFGALLLNTPAAIVLFFLYWYALPGVLALLGLIADWVHTLVSWINFQVATSPLTDGDPTTHTEWGKVLVSGAIWLALPLVLGIWRIMRAEVK